MFVDTHTHFYDPERPEGVPFPRKDDPLLYRRVLPEHFLEEAMPCNVSRTVVVEASRWVDDNYWMLQLASSNACIVAFIAGVDPKDPAFKERILKLSAFPVFRGIRLRQEDLKDLSPETLDNLSILEKLGLSLDLLARPEDLDAILKIANRYPTLSLIIDHICDLQIDGARPGKTVITLLDQLGAQRNIYCKISALQELCADPASQGKFEYYTPMLDQLCASFPESRLLYGSNWPVCERAGTYASQFNIVKAYFAEKGNVALTKVMQENSKRCYGWNEL